jgi:hypothetical protein
MIERGAGTYLVDALEVRAQPTMHTQNTPIYNRS